MLFLKIRNQCIYIISFLDFLLQKIAKKIKDEVLLNLIKVGMAVESAFENNFFGFQGNLISKKGFKFELKDNDEKSYS